MSNVVKPVISNVYRPGASAPRFTVLAPLRSTLTLSAASFRTNSQVLPEVFRTSDAYGVAHDAGVKQAKSPHTASSLAKRFNRIIFLPSISLAWSNHVRRISAPEPGVCFTQADC